MSWTASLDLRYAFHQDSNLQRTVALANHVGPLRILQSLYPEGDAVCHNVLVHPPGGLVGGDTLDIKIEAEPSSHGLITTPGATRFYRSENELAVQRTNITLKDKARLEWLPLEAICYSGCLAENRLTVQLAPSAEFMGWDITALGLPHAQQPFVSGHLQQHIEIPGVWLERSRIAANDSLLLESPLGLAGMRCMATLFFASGTALARNRKEQALEAARQITQGHSLAATAGASCPNPHVVVVRLIAAQVEPAMQLLRAIRLAWRQTLWGMAPHTPRIWAM